MKKYKLNLFDILALVILGLFALTVFFALKNPSSVIGKDATLSIRVSTNNEIVEKEAQEKGTVYFNGTKNAVEISSVNLGKDSFDIELKGKGEKRGEVYIFNGQRILIGQKAELHGRFFAQGLITEFTINEN